MLRILEVSDSMLMRIYSTGCPKNRVRYKSMFNIYFISTDNSIKFSRSMLQNNVFRYIYLLQLCSTSNIRNDHHYCKYPLVDLRKIYMTHLMVVHSPV